MNLSNDAFHWFHMGLFLCFRNDILDLPTVKPSEYLS